MAFVVVVYENLGCFNNLLRTGFSVPQMMATGFYSVSMERMAIQLDQEVRVLSGFCGMVERLKRLLLPLDGMLKLLIYIISQVKRGTVRTKCLA